MVRKIQLFVLILTINLAAVKGQESNEPQNLSSRILAKKESKLEFGGYGQVDFSKQLLKNTATNASLDVSRLILSMGYNFSSKTSFFFELEYEHVKEIFVEQAFINHNLLII